jgi:Tol biopolymer transport system component
VRRSLRFAGLCIAAAVIGATGAAGVGGENEVASACPATASFSDEPGDHTPSWSPDGRSIAFASNRDGTFQIYVLNVADCAVRQVTRGTSIAYGPDWSPDGRRLVFERNDGSDSDLWIVGANGDGLRRLTRGPSTPRRESFDLFPDWSRRGVIVFARDESSETAGTEIRNLYAIRPDGRGLRRLTNGGWHTSPSWSHDGRRLAWVCGKGICRMQADGKRRGRVAAAGTATDPAWHPNGRALVISRGGLHVLPFGGRLRRITPGLAGGDLHPDWSRDGGWIVFESFSGQTTVGSSVYVVRPDGSGLTALTAAG